MIDREIPIDGNTEVEEITRQLCRAINNSPQYLKYKELHELIEHDDELFTQISTLRRNLFCSHNGSNGRMGYDEYHNNYNAIRTVRQNTLANAFIDAELDFIRMMQQINDDIIRSFEFECDFL